MGERLGETPHRYTVDVILHGSEPHPCVICGEGRNAEVHELDICPRCGSDDRTRVPYRFRTHGPFCDDPWHDQSGITEQSRG